MPPGASYWSEAVISIACWTLRSTGRPWLGPDPVLASGADNPQGCGDLQLPPVPLGRTVWADARSSRSVNADTQAGLGRSVSCTPVWARSSPIHLGGLCGVLCVHRLMSVSAPAVKKCSETGLLVFLPSDNSTTAESWGSSVSFQCHPA